MFTSTNFLCISDASSSQDDTMEKVCMDDTFDIDNPFPRCPVILLLDVSGSMDGDPINELNEGYRQFITETNCDESASNSVELEVITFESDVNVAVPFKSIYDVDSDPAPFVTGGMTSMGAALRLATEHLHQRRQLYNRSGIPAYKPWVILMTDGGPNDDWQEAAQAMRELAENGSIQYLGIEIGDSVSHDTMCQILPATPGPLKLKGLRFKEFFRWLKDSLSSVSSSAVGEEENVPLPPITWGALANM